MTEKKKIGKWRKVEDMDDLRNTRTCVPVDERRIYCDMGSNWYRNWYVLDLPPLPRRREIKP